jgi:hypothetical protein
VVEEATAAGLDALNEALVALTAKLIEAGVDPKEAGERLACVLDQGIEPIMQSLHEDMPRMLREHRQMRRGFEARSRPPAIACERLGGRSRRARGSQDAAWWKTAIAAVQPIAFETSPK